jgi:hypothetical protein
MANWTQEGGPKCTCGNPTMVVIEENGRAALMCLFHSYEEGALFPLPNNGRPDHWPNLTHEELKELVDQGVAEEDALTKKEE